MITIQQRFAVCVQTAVLLYPTQHIKISPLRALKCLEEACRVPSRYYRDLDVPAEAHAFVEYWMNGAKAKGRPEWLARWIKDRRPEN